MEIRATRLEKLRDPSLVCGAGRGDRLGRAISYLVTREAFAKAACRRVLAPGNRTQWKRRGRALLWWSENSARM